MIDRLRGAPLSGFLFMFIAVLILPSIGLGWASWIIDRNVRKRVEEIQTIIQDVDESINKGGLESEGGECVGSGYVEVEYHRDGTIAARDTYVREQGTLAQFKLVERKYYMNSRVIARDTFGPVEGIQKTVKWRQYYNGDGEVFLQEYFTQGGIGLSKKYLTTQNTFRLRRNFTRSPFPPIFMTFVCYR